jgi:hypothetical protein
MRAIWLKPSKSSIPPHNHNSNLNSQVSQPQHSRMGSNSMTSLENLCKARLSQCSLINLKTLSRHNKTQTSWANSRCPLIISLRISWRMEHPNHNLNNWNYSSLHSSCKWLVVAVRSINHISSSTNFSIRTFRNSRWSHNSLFQSMIRLSRWCTSPRRIRRMNLRRRRRKRAPSSVINATKLSMCWTKGMNVKIQRI